MEVAIRENVPARRMVAMRHTGPYWQIGPAFERLTRWLCDQGVRQEGPGAAIYYDDPETTPEAALRSDACAPVSADFATDDPNVRLLDLPGGRYAVYTHIGHYSGLGTAWGRLMGEWLPASGHAIDDTRPCFEIYLNDCTKVPAEELCTELYEPIR